MTPNEARVAIINRLTVVRDALTVETELNDNIAYLYRTTDGSATWMRLTVRFNGSTRGSLGGTGVATRGTRYGIATVQVFTPAGTGEYENDVLCETIFNEFDKQSGDKPLYYGGNPAGGEVRTESVGIDGSWYQQNVIIPFWFEQIRG